MVKWSEETPLGRKRRARKVNRMLALAYPDAKAELDFGNPWELLVATVLSAQTTDVRVNQVTPALFAAFPTPEALVGASREEVEELIKPTGFYRNKTNSLLGLARAIATDYDGKVPDTLEQLVRLPGVGRKTANVVLGNAFGKPGITVDTHLGRLARRMQFTEHTDPVQVEKDLAVLIEPKEWTMFSHRMIFHGRRVCHSRRAACGVCSVSKLCPSAGKAGPMDIKDAAKLVKGPERAHLLNLVGVSFE